MSQADAAAVYAIGIIFRYDDGAGSTEQRYTTSEESITHTTWGAFTPEPRIEAQIDSQDGTAEHRGAMIEMPFLAPLDAFRSRNGVFPPIWVELYDLCTDDPDGTMEMAFAGRLTRVAETEDGIARLDISGIKAWLEDVPLGLVAQSTCAARFGDSHCQVDVGALEETATVTEIAGKRLTVSGLTTTASSRYWHRGHVQLGDLRIMIREYGTGQTFLLMRQPPADWDGETVTLTPGCDKTTTTCEGRWSNIANFLGCGYGMPASNPQF